MLTAVADGSNTYDIVTELSECALPRPPVLSRALPTCALPRPPLRSPALLPPSLLLSCPASSYFHSPPPFLSRARSLTLVRDVTA